jgi:hypothetical protein
MPDKGWNSIAVREKAKQHFEQMYEERKHELLDRGIRSFSGFMQEVLSDVIEQDEVLKRYGPLLQNHGIDEQSGTILIKDNRIKRIAELVIRDGEELYCKLDDTNNCVHIGYAWAIPKLYRTMMEYGMKRPDKIEAPSPSATATS